MAAFDRLSMSDNQYTGHWTPLLPASTTQFAFVLWLPSRDPTFNNFRDWNFALTGVKTIRRRICGLYSIQVSS